MTQVLQVVKALPDQVVAGEIRARGVAETMTRSAVERVEKAGGGPQTLQALRALIVMPALTVRSNQDRSEVYLDDILKGTAGPGRPLTIRDADAGTHTVVVRKRRYSIAQQQVVLQMAKAAEVNATLQLAVGTVTVTTNAPHAQVRIEGVDLPGANARNVELTPGAYVLHVEAPQFLSVTKNVTVKAGDELQLSVPLTIDPEFARSLIERAQAALKAQDYSGAARLAAGALQVKPGDAHALTAAAMSSFYLRDYTAFSQYGMQAIEAGGTLDIPVVHHHTLRSSHRAYLRLSANTLAYDPNGQPGVVCNQPPFQVPLANLRGCDLKQDQRQQVYLNIKVAAAGPNRQQSLLFADYRATAEAQPNGLISLVAPPDGPTEISTAAGLIENVWRKNR